MSIEAVILLPVFLGVLLVIVEASLWVYASSLAQAAAQDGARVGAGARAASAEAGEQAAREILEDRPSALDQWDVLSSEDSSTLTVTVTGYAPTVIPGLTFPVTESASLPWELPR